MAKRGDFWRDSRARFDIRASDYALANGETIIDFLDQVEDTKGNNGTQGQLSVTNLRLLWHATDRPKINLSVGFLTIKDISIRTAKSRLRGQVQALYVMVQQHEKVAGNRRYQFIFTHLVESPRLFTTVIAVYKAYASSRLYRDVKLRGFLFDNQQLLVLPHEEIKQTIKGVWNLSNDQGNLGAFYITNIRVIWVAESNPSFNASVPFLQMRSIGLEKSKFGKALVIKTSERGGAFTLGFRIDPVSQLEASFRAIAKLLKTSEVFPIFGVDYASEAVTAAPAVMEMPVDDVDIVDEDATDAFAAYFEGDQETDRTPVFSPDLGLAIETLPPGLTLEKLWVVS